ncbi:MAG: phosphatidylglycerol lysyltransferase domain-containing protein [Actinomycetes bacterium]
MLKSDESSNRGALAPKFAGLFAFIIGVIDLSRFFAPDLHATLTGHLSSVPGTVRNATVLNTIFTGTLLILLADGLARRKFRAWLATEILLLVSILLRLVLVTHSDLALWALSSPIALFVFLFIFRKTFYAKPAPGTRLETLKTFLTTAGVALIGSACIVYIRLRELTELNVQFSLHSVLLYSLPGFAGVSTDISNQNDFGGDFAFYALFALGLAVIVPTLYAMLRSHKPLPQAQPNQDAELRLLLDTWGEQDSLGYFALRPDKMFSWSPTRKACISYRVVGGVAIASGDPLGDLEAWPGAIESFITECKQNGWIPAAAATSEAGAEVWVRETQMSALEIGDEAIVEVPTFTLEGRAMRNVRQMVNRVRRQGYTTQVATLGELTETEAIELAAKSIEWRVGKTERGYSMALGRIDAKKDPNVLTIRAFRDGQLTAFLTFVPWGTQGMSLDFMRRSPESDPGITELLICDAIEGCAAREIKQVSLNFAAFRDALERGDRIGAGPVSKFNRGFLRFVSRWIQIDSLYRFNAKFRPIWEPRYLIYNGGKEFLRAGLAYIKAEGFI